VGLAPGPCLGELDMNKAALTRSLAWSLAALAIALAVVGTGAGVRAGEAWLAVHLLFGPLTAVSYGLVGALVASRQPRNIIGWLFCAEALLAGATLLAANYDALSLWDSLFGHLLARWLSLWVWIPTTLLPLTFLLLLFPDGRLPSSRWRPVAWAAGLGMGGYILSTALHPRPPIDPDPQVNPFGIPGAASELEALGIAVAVLIPLGVIGALASLVERFRRSRGVERDQIKWLAYGSSVGLLSLVVINLWAATRRFDPVAYELSVGMVWVAITIIVVAAGIAILRHHLYNIDLLINRTLVYGALSAGVVGLYVLLVGALGALFQASGNPLVALLATGLAALLVQPLRARLQRAVNRLMYGERDDPYAVLSGLSQQLKTTIAPGAVLPRIAQTVAQALKLPYVALALQQGERLEVAAAYGQPAGESLALPLVYQGEPVGQLHVTTRAANEPFTPAERRLLDDIALQAGVAAHAVRLTADLQRSRERLVAAREEERRRLHRDLHDGLGPQLASLTLTIAAARELLRHDVDAVDTLLQELAAHTHAAVADVRRVVYDLRPPALDDLGLVLALREQGARYGRAGLAITVDAPERLPPLPAAVEVAAYRIVQEALTNVVRHARAHRCIVRLNLDNALWVEIQDDGVGLPQGGRAGVGLSSMRERAAELGGVCQVESWPGRGTRIRAQLPLEQEGVCTPFAS
jgi:two-component system NarL family sensor kinase